MFRAFFLLLTFVIPSLASITPVSTTSSTLLSFGTAHTTQTYLLTTPEHSITSITIDAPTKSSRPILSSFSSRHTQLETGVYNITLDLYFESWVGNFDYALIVDTVSSKGAKKRFTHVATHGVYGMVVYQSNNTIVSGDEAVGVMFDHFLTPGDVAKELNVMTYAPDGVDMTATLSTRDTFSSGSSKVLNDGAVKLENGVLRIRPRDFTSGSAVVDITCSGLEMRGEVYESVLMVSVSQKPKAPAFLVKANASVVEGVTKIEGVVWNGGEGVELLINGTVLKGEMTGEEIYEFKGVLREGIYEDLRIVMGEDEGVVSEGLVMEVLGNGLTGKSETVGVAVITLVVIGVVMVLVVMALIAYRRSIDGKRERVFIDGRAVHIARDVYGRGSLHV